MSCLEIEMWEGGRWVATSSRILFSSIYLFILFIYLFSFFPVGRGALLQVSPITAGPFVQVCSGGGNSPQHRH